MKRPAWGRIALLLALFAAIALLLLQRDRLDVEAVSQWIAQAGPAAPLLFMGLYALATVLFLPGSALTLLGGALFGPLLGTFYNLTAATLGAAIAFLLARHLAGDWVERKAGDRIGQVISGVESEGWRFVAFTRLVPLFPFNLLNYALGLTRIRFGHYLLTSYVCMLPGTLAYTYLGHVGQAALSGEEGLIQKGLLALAAISMMAFLPRLIGRLRRGAGLSIEELNRQLSQTDAPLLIDVRERRDFNGDLGHIDGALNIPLGELAARADELSDHLERPVALICRAERSALKAAGILARRGFGQLHVVNGGMTAWREAGLPSTGSAEQVGDR